MKNRPVVSVADKLHLPNVSSDFNTSVTQSLRGSAEAVQLSVELSTGGFPLDATSVLDNQHVWTHKMIMIDHVCAIVCYHVCKKHLPAILKHNGRSLLITAPPPVEQPGRITRE